MTSNRSALPGFTTAICFVTCLSVVEHSASSVCYTKNLHQEDLFQHLIHTCRYPSCSHNKNIPGYNCPKCPPIPYSSSNKYAPNVRWNWKHKYPHDVIWGCGSNPPVMGEFCNGEVLQLQVDMPQNISRETAITAYYGLSHEAPFFCPESFSNHTSDYDKHDYCPSEACRQRLPFRSGGWHRTYADFGVAGNTWYLNVTLQESPGRHGITTSFFSCPPDSCKLWKGISVNPKCCSCTTNFDLIIHDTERNSFTSPATSIGGGLYNVTLHKSDAFVELEVNDTIHNQTVKSFPTKKGVADIVLTLLQGVYQVSGTVSHLCGAEEMQDPITLLPLNATFSPVETLSFSRRKLSWKIVSDIPISAFELYPLDDPQQKISTKKHTIEFSIGGDEIDQPAPLNRTFVHRICYTGVSDEENPTEFFPFDLSQFLPANITFSISSTSTSLSWYPPEAEAGFVSNYRLTAESTANNPKRVFNIKSSNTVPQGFSYTHDHYLAGETAHLELGALFRVKTGQGQNVYWWGPVDSIIFTVTGTSTTDTHSPTSSTATIPGTATSATTRQTSASFPATTGLPPPSDGPENISVRNNNLAIILGGVLGGSVLLASIAVSSFFVGCFCHRQHATKPMLLFDPNSIDD